MDSYLKDIYKNKKVLITGHTGFKGSWLSFWLIELGANVIGYSLEPPTQPNLFESINLKDKITHILGDVREEKYLFSVFEKYQPEFVFHLAAQSLVRFSYKEPKITYETNIAGTVNVLEAVRKTESVKVCIIVTSDKCYENKEWIYGYRETDPMGGYDPYSSSKGCVELVTAAYRRSFFSPEGYGKMHNVALSSVRAGNVIGGGDWGEDRLIPDCVRALSQDKTIIIRNPQAIRPWQYVLEPLSGYLLLGTLMYEDGARYSDSWNFGPNDESIITVEELVKLIIKYWGSGTYTVDKLNHPHEASLLKLDASKSKTLLGWKPIYNVYESVEKTIKWYKNFYDGMTKEKLYAITGGEIEEYYLPDTEKELRRDICCLIENFYKKIQASEVKKFIPGKTYIPYAGRVYNEEEIISLVDSSLDFWLTAGRFAKQFEEEFAKFLGIRHCLLTNSGSSANLLAVSALTSPKLEERRLNPGDEVITTACAFPTTVNPIIQNNLIPVFLDVDLGTYNIQADKIEGAISEKTKAIFLAHTLGNPFNLDKVLEISQKYNLWVIEDNCDALGSKYNEKYTGCFGHIGTSSFYPAHHITMGEGGALVTNDTQLKKLIESFRDWGRDCWCEPGHDNTCGKRFGWQLGSLPFGYDHKYIYSHIGYNLKITDMQAAIGVAQLKKLPAFIEARKKNFDMLYNGLKKYEEFFILPQPTPNSEPSWFGFPLTVKENAEFSRAEIVHHLEKNHIATRMLFSGNLVKQPAYQNVKYRIIDSLKNTDFVMDNTFWLGVYPGLTKEIIEFILKIIASNLNNKK